MFDRRGGKGYLVESYWPGASAERLGCAGDRAVAAAADLGAGVVFIGSILVPADETVFSLFDGREDDVRAVTSRAGVPVERIVESLRINPNPPSDRARSTRRYP